MKKDRENLDRKLIIRLPQSLFDDFEAKCANDYKGLSEVVRDLIVGYVRKENNER